MPTARRCWGIAAILGALSLTCAPARASAPPQHVERIALIEHGHRVSRSALARGAEILTYQVNHQLRRFWPGPKVAVQSVKGHVPPTWGMIVLVGTRSPRLTGGYHTTGAHGRLLAVVYSQRWGRHWTVGASHELLEMLQDPVGDSESSSYLEEICDPVQFVWYWLHGMYVADFVTPSWFTNGPGPWDVAGRLHAPRTFARGGEEDYDTAAGWHWIGPGAVMTRPPKPVRLRRIPPAG
jgi:hypothetical protein